MLQHLRPAFVMTALFAVLTGVIYPLGVTAASHVLFPNAAGGSLIVKDGKIVGSNLIGQAFTSDRYFHPRPSATSAPDPQDAEKTVDAPYNAASSAGSNLGPITQKLLDRVKGDVEVLRAAGIKGPIPVDAVTASASGLDPHISPDWALMQVPRVATARGLAEARVRAFVADHIENRALGILGEPRVNVLMLNLALDALKQ
jgi:potassium-transporting ATPase KdpC subunit